MRFEWLVIGLGNPGKEYAGTRHNFGFMVLDAFLDQSVELGFTHSSVKSPRSRCALWRCDPIDRNDCGSLLLAKPETYMNLSGDAAAAVSRFHEIPPERVLVVHDELDLPLGRVKFKNGGGTAGHKGLLSIAERLSTRDFPRLRLGTGKPLTGEATRFVLARFSKEEQIMAKQVLAVAVLGLVTLVREGLEPAMRLTNGFQMTENES